MENGNEVILSIIFHNSRNPLRSLFVLNHLRFLLALTATHLKQLKG